MAHSEQYERLIEEWEAQLDVLESKIFLALKAAYPGGRTRRQLIFDVFGDLVPNTVDLNNNLKDRKIRLTIAKLRDQNLIPIYASSGGAGYRLDLSESAIVEMINEWAQRESIFHQKVQRGNVLRMRLREIKELPAQLVKPGAQPKQLSLME